MQGTKRLRGEAEANPKRFLASFGTGSAISCNDSASDCFAAARNDNKPVNVLMKRYASTFTLFEISKQKRQRKGTVHHAPTDLWHSCEDKKSKNNLLWEINFKNLTSWTAPTKMGFHWSLSL